MFRRQTITIFRRLYHDSSRQVRRKEAVVKVASSRVARTLREREAAEHQPVLTRHNPSKTFEPFPFVVNEDNKFETLNAVTSPLHKVPYEEQLISKESHMKNSLRYLAQQLYKLGTPVRLDVSRLPCHVRPIIKSPVLEAYRNKDEFSIWRGYDGEQVVVGHLVFPIGKHGDSVCVEPNGSPVMREESIKVANILQDFVRNRAKLPICYSLGTDGGWRRFAVRINSNGELMIIGIANPRTLRVGQLIEDRDSYRDFVVQECNEAGLKLKSLYFQPCPSSRCPDRDVPFELVHGDPTISETINGFKFRVSPESYMPASTVGVSLLYDTIGKTIHEAFPVIQASKHKPLVIDITCGSGIGSVHLAEIASKVVGVDYRDQSIDDAVYNAEINGVTNAKFLCSKAEFVLEKIIEKDARKHEEIIILASPPSSGLNRAAVETLRNCRQVTKIIFVSAKTDSLSIQDNLIKLCAKETNNSSQPFIPVLAVPVDTTPHVEHYETIIYLERLPK